MNKHTKLALLVAPILAIVGYIASDTYIEYQVNQPEIFQLSAVDKCDIAAKACLLVSGEFKVSIYTEGDLSNKVVVINSTAPLNEVTLFVVNNNQVQAYPLVQKNNRYYWQSQHPITLLTPQKLRLIAKVKGGHYIAEFTSQ
jgi:hypothetical protein